ncbi:DUF6427 family protein [Lutibacter sp.]
MIANFFSKTKPVNIFGVIVLLYFYYFASTLLFHSGVLTFLYIGNKLLFFFWYILLLLLVYFIIKKNSLTKDNAYPLLLFAIFLGTFYTTMFSKEIIFSNLFLLLGARKIYSLKTDLAIKKKLFDAGFLIAIASLIYFWSIVYLLLVYIGLIVYNKIDFKNSIIPVIGVFTPFFLYFTYFFYSSGEVDFGLLSADFSFPFDKYNSLTMIVPIFFSTLILVWAILSVNSKMASMSYKFKSSWKVLLSHLALALLIVMVSPSKDGSELLFLFFPIAIMITNFLERIESAIIKNSILYLFFIISVWVYFL